MNLNRDNTPIRFVPPREDRFSADTSKVGTRPAGDPKSAKNFEKILRKGEEEDEKEEKATSVNDEGTEEHAAFVAAEELAVKKARSTSLFDLSSKASHMVYKDEKKTPLPPENIRHPEDRDQVALQSRDRLPEETSEDSLEDLYAKINAKQEKRELPVETEAPVTAPLEEKKDQAASRFATDQQDLSYVNPMAAIATQGVQPIQAISSEKITLPPVDIKAIIDQLVEKVVLMETNGKSDTVITLKHPPMFAGADLVVTAFDSAKGEFNITFQKLTQAAKEVLDMEVNRQSLLTALEQKGYAVHIITATTLVETNLPPVASSPSQDRQREPDQQKQQQKQPGKQKG